MSSTLTSPSKPPAESSRKDLRDLLDFLRRRWLVILALALLGAGAGAARAVVKGPTYEASASILFRADPVLRLAGLPSDFQGEGDPTQPGSAMQTQLLLVKQPPVADAAKRALHSSESRDELLSRVRVQQDLVSSVVRVIGRDDTAAGAARLANTWATAFVAMRNRELDARITRGRDVLQDELDDPDTPAGRKRVVRQNISRLTALRAARPHSVELVSLAEPPGQAVGAGPLVSAGVGLIIGVVLGFGAGFALDWLGVALPRSRAP